MTIEIKFDTNALSSIIEKDDDFRIKIQQCVLENIARRHVKGVSSDIQHAVQKAAEDEKKSIASEYGTYTTADWSRTLVLKDSLRQEIKDAIRKAAKGELDAYLRALYVEEVEKAKKTIEANVKYEVERLTKNIVAAEVKARVEAAVAQIKL